MSLTTSLFIGRSALLASQVGLQVAGDNLANAATPGFHRRTVNLTSISGGVNSRSTHNGIGVQVSSVTRQIDEALESRLRDAIAQQQGASVDYDVLSQIEALTNHLSDLSLDNRLDEFFNAFSELANNPNSNDTRTLIVEQGAALASYMRTLRADLNTLRTELDDRLEVSVKRVNEITAELASLDNRLALAEQGVGPDAALRDQRESLLSELSELIDVSISEQQDGRIDIFVGSTPLVQAGVARPLALETVNRNGVSELAINSGTPGTYIRPTSGRIGALLNQRNGVTSETIEDLDTVAGALIGEVNRLHSQGLTFPGLTTTVSAQRFTTAEQALALNDPTNLATSNLPFSSSNGLLEIAVVDAATGVKSISTIEIDLDGIDNTGAAGFADDTSLQDIVDAINSSVPNLNAQITSAGELQVWADPGFEFGFTNDTSGVLSTVGVNTFFTGTSAADIGVRQALRDSPQHVVAGLIEGSNERALAIAQLRDSTVSSLGGSSIKQAWRQTVDRVAVATSGATTRRNAAAQVRESLQAQRDSVSGVSVDEESVNMLTFQRQFQAAARLIATVDEMTQILIDLV